LFYNDIYKKSKIMANIYDVHSVIVPADAPNLTAHTYNEVYGGSAGCSITINGIVVSVGAGSNLNITIRTLSGGTGCYLLGENQNFYANSNTIGGTY